LWKLLTAPGELSSGCRSPTYFRPLACRGSRAKRLPAAAPRGLDSSAYQPDSLNEPWMRYQCGRSVRWRFCLLVEMTVDKIRGRRHRQRRQSTRSSARSRAVLFAGHSGVVGEMHLCWLSFAGCWGGRGRARRQSYRPPGSKHTLPPGGNGSSAPRGHNFIYHQRV